MLYMQGISDGMSGLQCVYTQEDTQKRNKTGKRNLPYSSDVCRNHVTFHEKSMDYRDEGYHECAKLHDRLDIYIQLL